MSSPQITAVGCLHQEKHSWEDWTGLNLPGIRKITMSEVPFTGWTTGVSKVKKKILPLEGQNAGGQSAGFSPRALLTSAPARVFPGLLLARYPPCPPTLPLGFSGLPKVAVGDQNE